jgi:hypothetical protein
MGANFTGGANNTVRVSSVLDAGNGGVNVYAGADIADGDG